MHRRSTEIVETDRKEEETVPDADHPLDRYRIRNTVIGALVFGYYFGFVLSRFYIQDDIQSLLREVIRTGVLGAVVGSAIGGWVNDGLGRRFALLIADTLIFVGGVLLIMFLLLLSISDSTSDCCWVTVGKTIIGMGVGMASVTSPIYIIEVSSTHLQENLHTCNYMLFAVGKFIFFCADITVTSYSQELNKNSDYMIAVAGFPALLQFLLMLSLPDSPIWLYKRNRKECANKALRKIYNSCEADKEFEALKLSIKNETTGQDEKGYSDRILSRIRSTWSNPLERRKIVVGIGLQVAEQLVSENTIIYVFPRLLSMCGLIRSSSPKWDIWCMKFSLFNFCGIYGIHGTRLPYYTMKLRWRKNLLVKSYRMMVGLLGLSLVLIVSHIVSPNNIGRVSSKLETITHFGNNTCPSYISAPDADTWDCFQCLQAGCGFCAGIDNNYRRAPDGACLSLEPNGKSPSCLVVQGIWFIQDSITRQCEIKLLGPPVPLLLLVCLVPYTFGLESHTHSRRCNTEVRGRFVGAVRATNWISFLVVIVSFFMITKAGGRLFSMLLISLICFSVTRLIKLSYFSIPEIKGSFPSKDIESKVS